MRYLYFGKTTPYVGKTLWEILGNLKNFGVGRMLRKCTYDAFPEVSYFVVTKVIPVPPSKSQPVVKNRKVMVWVDEIYRGNKLENKSFYDISDSTMFHLIPKIEEKNYTERLKEKPYAVTLSKHCPMPPLFKKMWEKENAGKPVPLIPTIPEKSEIPIVFKDEVAPVNEFSLGKTKLSVHEMYLEIVRLKLFLKSQTQV